MTVRRTLLLAFLLALPFALAARAQTPATTIENAGGTRLLQLNDDGGLAVFGAFDSGEGTIPIEGAGTRLMWYPEKAAFRAGRVSGSQWDDENVGAESTALSFGTTASGTSSTAMGFQTTAEASYSTAMGLNTSATGLGSTAMGNYTTAASLNSLSIGEWNEANQEVDGTLFVVGNGTSSTARSDALKLDWYGNLTIAGNLTQDSDRRLKTDVAPLEGSVLDALSKIRPVRYRFREGTGHPTDRQVGLIAQEVQRHFPELVAEGSGGYLSLSYSKLTAVLVKGVQEMESENAALRSEVDTLRERLDRMAHLEARLAALEDGHTGHQRAGWMGPAGLLLGLILAGAVVWQRRTARVQ